MKIPRIYHYGRIEEYIDIPQAYHNGRYEEFLFLIPQNCIYSFEELEMKIPRIYHYGRIGE